MKKISVITAVYNDLDNLKNLAKTIVQQNHSLFSWVIKDNLSTDGTKDFIQSLKQDNPTLEIVHINDKDVGIYDALNIAINYSYDYYTVFGADDLMHKGYIECISDKLVCKDLVYSVNVKKGNDVFRPKNSFLKYGHLKYISEHSVGCIIPKCLHNKYGFYNTNYKIAGDRDMILRLVNHNVSFKHHEVLAGTYSLSGISNRDLTVCYDEILLSTLENIKYKKMFYIYFKLKMIVKKINIS